MNMTINIEKLGEFAKGIVYEAGQLLLELKNKPLEMQDKKDQGDLVTIVDQTLEKFLVEKILENYPDHGILGEEGTFEGDLSKCDTLWVIDPIDGTTNFIHNIPFYGISVGIVHQNEGVIGVVYNPLTDKLYFASKGNGAFINDQQVKIESRLQLRDCVFSTSMFWENVDTKAALHPNIIELYKETRGMRMLGGAAISLCEILTGTFSAYVMPMLSAWDFAGGAIILKEAGGIVTQLNGDEVDFTKGSSLLAAHPDIHNEILKKFK
jgi:myo-inositol-1(or 4)-monophosphatase